jgi:hypothetical protein
MTIDASEQTRLQSLIAEHGLADAADLLIDRAHPMIVIRLAALDARENRQALDVMPIAASRWGGKPDVPTGFDWPQLSNGTPFHFALQLDLAATPRFADWPLPESGLLSAFIGMNGDGYGIDARIFHFAAEAGRLVRMAPPNYSGDDLYLEYFSPEFEPFLLAASLGIDIRYRDREGGDLLDLITARYPQADWNDLLNRYEAVSSVAADPRASEYANTGFPRHWWQVGQLFGATNAEHQEASASRRGGEAAHWQRLLSIESNAVTGFESLCDARPYRMLVRDPGATPWRTFDVETHIEMG